MSSSQSDWVRGDPVCQAPGGGLGVGPTEGSSKTSRKRCPGEIAKRPSVLYIPMGWTDALRGLDFDLEIIGSHLRLWRVHFPMRTLVFACRKVEFGIAWDLPTLDIFKTSQSTCYYVTFLILTTID